VPEAKPGDVIGRYTLLKKIGEGGCGIVYLAEQKEPVRRRVALKVIKLGMDTRAVIARFEAERQALAMMDHPDIARRLRRRRDGDRPAVLRDGVRRRRADHEVLRPAGTLDGGAAAPLRPCLRGAPARAPEGRSSTAT